MEVIDKEEYDRLAEKYYETIYDFCYSQLRDIHAAKDCTQEAFYIFFQKKSKLYNSNKIITWLYKTAENVIKRYRKENSMFVSLEDTDREIIDKTDYFNEDLVDEIYAVISKDEADLFIRYFNCDHGDRKMIADELNITTAALYKKVYRIREKLAKIIDKDKLFYK